MHSLITELKEADQDFEFYPTTGEIIRAMVRDYESISYEYHRRLERGSVLDIGAGNGKVLQAFKENGFSKLYAIEKSEILREQLPAEVFVVGTDFEQQSLLSKRVDLCFSNPPYSQFDQWAEKIIRESAARVVYLVIPERWQESINLQAALKYRATEAHVVGKFDFLNSEDRRARAKVELIRIEMAHGDDAFARFFDEQFPEIKAKFSQPTDHDKNERETRFHHLVPGRTYPEAMVALYNAEMEKVRFNYNAVGKLDADLLREFGISPAKVQECLKGRLDGMRQVYWSEIFGRLAAITDRLTTTKRRAMLETLNAHCHVDFTVSNIHAIVIWTIKNSGQHLDGQLIETFETMVSKANIRAYKSNTRPFEFDRWRYREDRSTVTHCALEFRIVLAHSGGIHCGWSGRTELEERAANFLQDILTVARNLGFQNDTTDQRLTSGRDSWEAGEKQEFHFTNKEGKQEQLLEVRAFKNGNMHIRMQQRFALALNVEYGRLKGWLRSPGEAAEEMQEPAAAEVFKTHFALTLASSPFLALQAPDFELVAN